MDIFSFCRILNYDTYHTSSCFQSGVKATDSREVTNKKKEDNGEDLQEREQ